MLIFTIYKNIQECRSYAYYRICFIYLTLSQSLGPKILKYITCFMHMTLHVLPSWIMDWPINHSQVVKDKSLSLTTEGVALSINISLVKENSTSDIHHGSPQRISTLSKMSNGVWCQKTESNFQVQVLKRLVGPCHNDSMLPWYARGLQFNPLHCQKAIYDCDMPILFLWNCHNSCACHQGTMHWFKPNTICE